MVSCSIPSGHPAEEFMHIQTKEDIKVHHSTKFRTPGALATRHKAASEAAKTKPLPPCLLLRTAAASQSKDRDSTAAML